MPLVAGRLAYSSWVVELLNYFELLELLCFFFRRSLYNCRFVLRSAWLSGSSDGEDNDARVPSPPASTTGAGSLLDTVVLAQWEDRAEQGLFRYDVTACPTKVLRERVIVTARRLYFCSSLSLSSCLRITHVSRFLWCRQTYDTL